MRKLAESDIAEIRRLVAAGTPQKDVSARFGISPSYVSRLVRGERAEAPLPAINGPVRRAVDEWLEGLPELDPHDQVRAEIARLLAGKLDATATAGSASSALALPRLAAGLGELVDDFQRRHRRLPDAPVERILQAVQGGR